MYSMVLMAAMVPSGDTAAFGGKLKGGCTGAVVAAGCHGSKHDHFLGHKGGCTGASTTCHGGGFLGGLFKHKGGCHGTPAPACGCCGTADSAVPHPPMTMPKPDPKPEVKPKPKTND